MATIPFINPAPAEPVPVWFYLLSLLSIFLSGVWMLATHVTYPLFVSAVWLSEAISPYIISATAHFSGAAEFERENARLRSDLENLRGRHKGLRKQCRELLASEVAARKEAGQMNARYLDEKSLVARLLGELSATNKAKFEMSGELRNLRLKYRSLGEQVASDDKAEAKAEVRILELLGKLEEMERELKGKDEEMEQKLKEQSDGSFYRYLALLKENEALEAKIKDLGRTHPIPPPLAKAAPPAPNAAPAPTPTPAPPDQEQPPAPSASNGNSGPKLLEAQAVRRVKPLRRRTPAAVLAANGAAPMAAPMAVPVTAPPAKVDEHPAEVVGYFSD